MNQTYYFQKKKLAIRAIKQFLKLLRNGNFKRLEYRKRLQWQRKIRQLKSFISSFKSKKNIKKSIVAGSFSYCLLLSSTANAQFEIVDVDYYIDAQTRGVDNLIDYDNDGDFDIVSDSFIYINSGLAEVPKFRGEKVALFSNIIGNHKHFKDIDNDGDLDIFTVYEEAFLYYNNVDNSFILSSIPEINLPVSFELEGLAIADLDNDGDFDFMFLGDDGDEKLLYFENIGTPNQANFSTYIEHPFNLQITSSLFDFVDIDADGDLDIVMENSQSANNFSWQRNTGDLNNPNFDLPIPFPYTSGGNFYIRSLPFADIDNDGDVDFFATLGNFTRTNYHLFRNNTIDTNVLPTSYDTKVEVYQDSIYKFHRADFPFLDSNPNDSLRHIVITKTPNEGRLFFDGKPLFTNTIWSLFQDEPIIFIENINKLTYVSSANKKDDFKFRVFDGQELSEEQYRFRLSFHDNEFKSNVNLKMLPNPASTITTVSLTATIKKSATLKIVNVQGQVTDEYQIELDENVAIPINVQHLTRGIYFVVIQTAEGEILSEKLMIE